MRIRRVIITRKNYIAESVDLSKEPSVRKCWSLPLGYMLFEFYHPVFERIYDDDVDISNSARMDERAKLDLAIAVSEERRLLAPLYQKLPVPSQALTLLVPSKTSMYHFVGEGKGRILWPNLRCSEGWERSTRISVRGEMLAALPETIDGLRAIVSDWTKSMNDVTGIKQMDQISLQAETFAFTVECYERSGDVAMALFVLLTETRHITSVQSVIFEPTQ